MLLAHKSELRRVLVRLQYFPFRIGQPAKSSLLLIARLRSSRRRLRPPDSWMALHTHLKAAFGEKNRAYSERTAHKSRKRLQSIFHNSFPLDSHLYKTPGILDERESDCCNCAAAVRAQSFMFANRCAAAAMPLRRPY
jgi:hypothetical protein